MVSILHRKKWFSSQKAKIHYLDETNSPIRSTSKSQEELYKLGHNIASGQEIFLPEYKEENDFRRRLIENSKLILHVFHINDVAARNNETIAPSAQWLIDNHYTIDKTIQQLCCNFSKSFIKQLPPYQQKKEIPRIFALAWLYVAHTDSRFLQETLTAMVNGFQKVCTLKISELWALPFVVRMILIENVRRLSLRIEQARYMRSLANQVADKTALAKNETQLNILTLYEKLTSHSTFSAHLFYRLRGTSVDSTRALTWLEEQLYLHGSSTEMITADEHTRQTTDGITMGNIIRALKTIDDVDWTAWFETVSCVDFILRENSDFSEIDSHSRNAYRQVIETIAHRSPLSEVEIARKAVEMAQTCSQDVAHKNNFSVGWYLVDDGRSIFEEACGYNPSFLTKWIQTYYRLKIGAIAIPVSLLILVLLFAIYTSLRISGLKTLMTLLFTALALFPTMDAAFAFFNTVVSWFVPPNQLIGYEYKEGIPEDARTIVVVPTLITSRNDIDEQIRNLEVHYLSNPQGAIHFALITDWADAPFAETQNDLDLLHYAQKGIAQLNHRYHRDTTPLFFLLHRRRLYNAHEKCWMGWERKRGKLHELNLLLRGNKNTSFYTPDPHLPMDCRFVMTLDSDTRLTPESVTKLVGKLNHPLNRPIFSKKNGAVVKGYSILQPRITPSLTAEEETSILQRVFSTNRGIDPYVFAVSDTYQDLLGEGTFTGKGLYNIDAFEQSLNNKIKDNTVLSHDLLEGSYARAALVSDVEIIEDYPTAYNVDIARHHRWIRGDWQLLPYLLNHHNTSLTTRWKMQDNLRRSLTPLMWLIAATAGWSLLPLKIAIFWQIFLLLSPFIAPILGVLRTFIPSSSDYSLRGQLQLISSSISSTILEMLLKITFIAHSAYFMTDAIIRALYRMMISKQYLLEWKTSSATKSIPNSLSFYIITMWPAVFIGIIAIGLPLYFHNSTILIALPFGLLWFFSPLIACIVSKPKTFQDVLDISISSKDKKILRCIARRTWFYYTTFVNSQSNYLPPDNFQEEPEPLVAQRTSPTNIGVYLLSIIAARDFGWISFEDAITRIKCTLSTLEKMEKFRGHLYNWYETDTLKPLLPTYVSTVDSGNLAGHLITLASALSEWAETPDTFLQSDLDSLFDVNNILEETLKEIPDNLNILYPLRQQIKEHIANFHHSVSALKTKSKTVTNITRLSITARNIVHLINELDKTIQTKESAHMLSWAKCLVETCEAHKHDITSDYDIKELCKKLNILSEKARQIAFDMKFDFLEQTERQLLSIGYRVQENKLDESCYDLLASEARLASLFAIAKGDIKFKHWFHLGRLLVPIGWKGALLSWSGSMFEYLMPSLVMHEPLGSILDQTNRLIIRHQIQYARKRRLPWGISEAAFNARDHLMNYQYSNFGVPSLGLQRGLSRNTVIAPYASLLAAQYMPAQAIANLKQLRNLGALGTYGYYDSIDFTPSRVQKGKKYAIVRNYYAHHHGMSILAINNVIFEGRIRDRFHRDPVIKAAQILLQERAPRQIPVIHTKINNPMRNNSKGFDDAPVRIITNPLLKPRATLLLSNGCYSIMMTANGSGYSRWHNYAITRFIPDASEDQQGTLFFIKDTHNKRWWSITNEPTRVAEEEVVSIFTDEKAEYTKTVDGLKSTLECLIASEGDGEGRRIQLINTTNKDRIIEITSYGELALATIDNDCAHPIFSRMFIETEILDSGGTILAKRRKRSPHDPNIHIAHFVTDPSGIIPEAEAETDRRLFISRGRSIHHPIAFDQNTYFKGNQGCVLDPIISIRSCVKVPAHGKAELIFWTFAADSKETLQHYIKYYRQPDMFQQELSKAWTHSQVSLYQNNISPREAITYQKYITPLIYPDRKWRLSPEILAKTLGKQSDLWPMSISGDYPICLLRLDNETYITVLRELLKAYEYWRMRGLIVDIVILNEQTFSYLQDTQRAIEWACESYRHRTKEMNGQHHIFTLQRNQISEQSFKTLLASARIILHAQNGSLSEQLKHIENIDSDLVIRSHNQESNNKLNYKKYNKRTQKTPRTKQNLFSSIALADQQKASSFPIQREDLQYWNGYGGFNQHNHYVVRLNGCQTTPHPWINIIANHSFGFHVSAEGTIFTWANNSRDYQLTPWSNDPITNRPGEALYLVDRFSLKCFSPVSAVECDDSVIYEACHGFGFSTFKSTHSDIALELTHTLNREKPIRFSRLIIKNKGKKSHSLRLYNYAEWVLGNIRTKYAPFIIPHYDPKRGAHFIQNPYHIEKSQQVTFLSASEMPTSFTTDRTEFIGTTGTVQHPQAIRKAEALSNTVEPGRDPCSALVYDIDLQPGQAKEIIFYLGSAENIEKAEKLLDQVRKDDFKVLLAQQKQQWNDFVSPLQVKTPDPSFDIMVNHWLPYQIYACRLMARSAFYQASGAFGFRDQLQDSLSLLLLEPQLAREHLLNAAAHQFPEGDVQHWWLPDTNAGVRTFISDDVVWLAYGTALYVNTTGDDAFLDTPVPFIEGPPLAAGQHDSYFQPTQSSNITTLYEHCALALDLAIKRCGPHNLPLILGGDWNDGMNLVGIEGKGESIWLGWFLGTTLQAFIPLAKNRSDHSRAKAWSAYLKRLTKALEKNGWDGAWYRRGYFDDATPLGSKINAECQIDAIAQSWAVISKMASSKRQKQAMASLLDHLYDEKTGLIHLFWPPFNKSTLEPGYIKGYPPGIRENGGQYTHGAIWSILALAEIGEEDKAYTLFSRINPINHGQNPEIYRVEPYVMAADIYTVEPYRGQGGWTWYTGSAGWFYRAATQTILGLHLQAGKLFLRPHLPSSWPEYEAKMKFHNAVYKIKVRRANKNMLNIDGKEYIKIDRGIKLKKTGNHEIVYTLDKQ
ncbi:MAG: Cyclic beta-1 2-glucan synthase [Bartonella clarridgeiae]|uniref:GH36-type glycosyl hydrolase domain-containing protein n=1 Tax=Bartonella clarridgeiae TaxID=56426 RepID=UPI0023F084E6|nr:glucoamylase family protein [Bartonella clarridgeiae]WCR55609.1 MAG: Cyclic beta-1 2-glucan synthase [Bartonella clarridgeiae]